jgi:hypothetical protein
MLPPPRCHHCQVAAAATALPLLPLWPRCCQAAAAVTKLPAATKLLLPPPCCRAAANATKLPATAKLQFTAPALPHCCRRPQAACRHKAVLCSQAAAKLPGVTFLVVWLCVVCGCVISAVFLLVGDGINHPLSQQVKMNKIAKNMIPSANSAERNQKRSVTFTRKNTDRGYILTQKMLPRVAHTFTKNVAWV